MSQADPARRKRWRRLGCLVVGGLPAACVVAALGGWIFLRTEAGNRFLALTVEAEVDSRLHEGNFEVGALHTNVWSELSLEEVHLYDDAQQELLGFERAALRWRPWSILGARVSVPELSIEGLNLVLQPREDGRYGLAHLFGPASEEPSSPWTGIGVNLLLNQLTLSDSRLLVATGDKTWELTQLEGVAAVRVDEALVSIEALQLSATLAQPAANTLRLAGQASWDGEQLTLPSIQLSTEASKLQLQGAMSSLSSAPALDLHLAAEPLSLWEVDAIAGGAGLQGMLQGDLSATGPLHELHLVGVFDNTDEAGGGLQVDLVADTTASPLSWRGGATFDDLDVAALYPGTGGALELAGTFQGGGDGLSWPDDLRLEGEAALSRATVREYALEASTLRLRIDQGAVHLQDTELATPYATANVSGVVSPVSGELDLQLHGRVDAAKLRAIGVEDLGGAGPFTARVTGNTLRPEEGTAVRGSVSLSPFRYDTDIRFQRADIRYDVLVSEERTDVGGSVVAHEGLTYGIAISDLDVPSLAITQRPDGSLTGRGEVRTVGVAQDTTWGVSEAAGSWSVERDARGGQNVDADLTLAGFHTLDQHTDSGRAVVHLRDQDVGFGVLLDKEDRRWLAADGHYRQDTAQLALSRLRWSPFADVSWEEEGPLRLTLVDGGVRDAHVALRSSKGRIRLDGALGTAGPIDGSLRLDHLDLATVQRLVDLDPELAGQLDLDLQVMGDAATPALNATVALTQLGASSLPAPLDIRGTITGRDDQLQPDLRIHTGDRPLATIGGSFPALLDLSRPGLDPRGHVDLQLRLLPGDLARLAPFTEGELPKGGASGELLVGGLLYDPSLRLRGLLQAEVAGWADPGRVEVDLQRRGGMVFGGAELYQGLTHRGRVELASPTRLHELFDWVLAEGPEPKLDDYELYASNLQLQAELDRVPAAALGNLAGTELGLDGVITGHAIVTGSPNTPQVTAVGTWRQAHLGDVVLGDTNLEARPLGDGYALSLDIHFPAEARPAGAPEPLLAVRGRLPVQIDPRRDFAEWGSGLWDLSLSGVAVPLQVLALADPGITRTRGEIGLSGEVHGELFAPLPQLAVQIQDGALDYTPLGLRVSHLQLDLEANERRVRLKHLRASTSPKPRSLVDSAANRVWATADQLDAQIFEAGSTSPSVVLAGTAALKDWQPERISGQVLLHNALLSATSDLTLAVTGTQDQRTHQALTVSGVWPALEVRGAVEVNRAEVLRDVVSFQETAPLALDPALRIHREGAVLRRELTEVAPPLYEHFDVAIDVDLGRNIEATVLMPFVDDYGELLAQAFRTDLRTRVGGKLDVAMERGQLALTGEVDVLDGSVRMLHRALSLKSGTLHFSGNDYLEPRLDLHAWTAISGADVNVDIGGTPSAPTFRPSSPAYADESQVLMMLLTGQRPEDVSARDGESASTLMSTGLGLLLGNTSGSLANIKGSFEPDGTVRIGVPASRYLFLEYTQRLQYSADLNNQETHGELTLPGLAGFMVEGTAGDHTSGANVVYEFRF